MLVSVFVEKWIKPSLFFQPVCRRVHVCASFAGQIVFSTSVVRTSPAKIGSRVMVRL